MRGKIVRWLDDRGFGFIAPDGPGDDLFCHINSIVAPTARAEPEIGQKVEYEVETSRSGRPQAADVKFI
jgi:CspA family cold shock protein